MTHLIFQIGNHPYALSAREIERVVPFVPLKPVPYAPDYLPGLLHYRHAPIPVIDLGVLLENGPTPAALSSRILLTRFNDGQQSQAPTFVGLLAPSVVETLDIKPEAFEAARVTVEKARYLGPVYADETRLIQRIELEPLLAAPIRETLLAAPLLSAS